MIKKFVQAAAVAAFLTGTASAALAYKEPDYFRLAQGEMSAKTADPTYFRLAEGEM